MTRKIFALVICILTSISSFAQIPNNEIWYTTTDGRKLDDSDPMPDFLVSHTFLNGKGVFKFSRDVIRIGDPGPVGIDDEAELEAHWKSLDYHMALAFGSQTRLKSVIIPKTVTRIIDYAFCDCVNLRNITIPQNVTEIGREAFRGCTGLTSITIPDNVTEIGYEAFKNCTSLRSITIPNSVTEIGEHAFEGCTSLTSITIPNSKIEIVDDAFEGCNIEQITINAVTGNIFEGCGLLDPSKVVAYTGKYASEDGRCLIKDGVLIDYIHNDAERYEIPNGVIIISDGVFKGCSSLKSITIPEGLTSIGSSTFKGCTNLTDINIPDSVTKIEWHAFSGCTGLTSINIPNSVTKIWNGTFFGCTGLTSITIPDNVTEIGDFAFEDCTSLTNITIPDSVTEIEVGAFHSCTSLKSINIPNSVTEIGEGAFEGCNIEQITINAVTGNIFRGGGALNPSKVVAYIGKYASEDGRCLIKDDRLIDIIHTGLTSYVIPDNITTIGEGVFKECSTLKEITIPNSVTTIGKGAFEGCNIERITINAVTGNIFRGGGALDPSKVVAYTGEYASVDGCCLVKDGVLIDFILGNLTSYVIPEGVKVINPEVFSRCYILTDITIPATVTQIGDNAFAGGSPWLSITCLSTTPPQTTTLGTSKEAVIYVPKKTVSAYKKAEGWTNYKKQIKRIKE